jgi:hypothetical protein
MLVSEVDDGMKRPFALVYSIEIRVNGKAGVVTSRYPFKCKKVVKLVFLFDNALLISSLDFLTKLSSCTYFLLFML